MALADFRAEVATVEFPGGGFSVRGLTLDDLSDLVRTHSATTDSIVKTFQSTTDMQALILGLLTEAPLVCAHIIALASDEPGTLRVAHKLPITVQIDAMQKVFKLTFESVGGLGNALTAIMGIVRSLGASQGQPSPLAAALN